MADLRWRLRDEGVREFISLVFRHPSTSRGRVFSCQRGGLLSYETIDGRKVDKVNEQRDPNKQDLESFQRFVDAFGSEGFIAGEWAKMKEVRPGVFQLGYWVASRIVGEWIQAIYQHNIIDTRGNHFSDEASGLAHDFSCDPRLLDTADLGSVRLALTRAVRGDRFCEGIIADTFRDGMAQAATRRLVALGMEME